MLAERGLPLPGELGGDELIKWAGGFDVHVTHGSDSFSARLLGLLHADHLYAT